MTIDEISTDVFTWIRERPHWLQLAAHQILTKGYLTDQDYNSYADLCVTEGNGASIECPNLDPSSLNLSKTSSSFRIVSVMDVKGINAL